MTIDARFVERATEPGLPLREHLVVEKLDRFWPGGSCAKAIAVAELLETNWRPVEIAGKSVAVREEQREPHLVLSREGNHVRGFTGCNRVAGSFEQDGDRLRFKPLAVTRMACLPEVGEQETAFLRALEATASQRIAGDTLELRDADGKILMRLEARQTE